MTVHIAELQWIQVKWSLVSPADTFEIKLTGNLKKTVRISVVVVFAIRVVRFVVAVFFTIRVV